MPWYLKINVFDVLNVLTAWWIYLENSKLGIKVIITYTLVRFLVALYLGMRRK